TQNYQADDTSGSTGVVAVITPTHVLVANAGDSRAILIQAPNVDVTVIPMSRDHTANDADER
ncbi:unnamed protein product, partial [Scytosiphon promiscuus]